MDYRMTSGRTRETYRPEERKNFAGEITITEYEAERLPEGYIESRLLYKVFDPDGEFVQALVDGEMHTIKAKFEKHRDYIHYMPGYRYRIYIDHARVATRYIHDLQVVPDLMSTGELWREFWRRVNHKRKKFGLGWLIGDFLAELERVQGWR